MCGEPVGLQGMRDSGMWSSPLPGSAAKAMGQHGDASQQIGDKGAPCCWHLLPLITRSKLSTWCCNYTWHKSVTEPSPSTFLIARKVKMFSACPPASSSAAPQQLPAGHTALTAALWECPQLTQLPCTSHSATSHSTTSAVGQHQPQLLPAFFFPRLPEPHSSPAQSIMKAAKPPCHLQPMTHWFALSTSWRFRA